MNVRELRPDDWPAVRAIYEDGIRSGDATFETETPSWETWAAAHPELRVAPGSGACCSTSSSSAPSSWVTGL